jgi:cytochrome P450
MADLSSVPVAGGNVFARSYDFAVDTLGFLERECRSADLMRVMLGPQRTWFTSSPALIEQLFVDGQKSFGKDRFAREQLGAILGKGLLTSDGDEWRRSRRLAQPAFHKERINGYAARIVAISERSSAKIETGKRVDMHRVLMHMTLEIVSESLFGTTVGTDADDVGDAIDLVSDRWTQPLRVFFPILDRLPLEQNRKFEGAIARLDEIVLGIVRRRRVAPTDSHDLLAMLLAARDEDGGSFSDAQLRDEIMTVYLAGHETTAQALSWALALLARAPDVQEALGKELDRVLGDRSPTLADMPALDLTGRVVLETLRLYPPAWAVGRETIEEVDFGGVRLPKGEQVWSAPWVMHRDPRFWPEPTRFDPDRWAKDVGGLRASESEMQKRLPRCVYYPFGAGPRLCIGMQFAQMEAVLALAVLAKKFRFTLASDARLIPTPSVTLRPKYGVPMFVDPR